MSVIKSVRRRAKRVIKPLISRPTQRSYDKVFCVGWLRTGTTSFAAAMEQLGFLHFSYDPDVWSWYQDGDVERVLELATRWESFDDLPWNKTGFIRTLDERFPGSRFVLSDRDPEPWLDSMRRFHARGGQPPRPKEELLELLEERNRFVRDYFADRPDDLLVLRICHGEGFEKLCPFLELPVPDDAAFPHANRGKR